LRQALPIALAALIGSAWPVLGQATTPNGQLTVRSDGFLFWLQDGQRHAVYPLPLSDEQINAYPEGPPLGASLMPGAPGGGQVPLRAGTGTSRSDRIPLGQACSCYWVRGTGQRADFEIRVTDVRRNAGPTALSVMPGSQIVRAGNEMVLVTVAIRYLTGPTDLPVSVDRFDFMVVDSNNTLHQAAFVMEPGTLQTQRVFPNAQITGSIAYEIPQNDPDPVLVWRFQDDTPVWFAIQ
jgi:hypothetical protein